MKFETLLIRREASLREALQQLEETERKALFVVDENRRLVGALTDGDVRRWILSGGDLDGCVSGVCNTRPFTVPERYQLSVVRDEMLRRQITCVPVTSVDGQVLDMLFWDSVFGTDAELTETPKINLPVFIMAGGKGTRLAPFTSVLPKPLIPLGEKTVIELIVDAFTAYGVDHFYLSLNYKSKIIKSYFDELAPPYSVSYIYENKPLGTAGSLYQLAGKLDRDLIVTNCDVIIRTDYHDLVQHHKAEDNDVTLVVSLKNYSIPYGVCEIQNGGHLQRIREKPEYNFLVSTGLYVLKPDVLSEVPPDEFFHITHLIEKLQAQDRRIGVYPIGDSAWIDIGEWAEYREAVAKVTADRRRQPR